MDKNKSYFYEGRTISKECLLSELKRSSKVSRISKTINMLESGETALDIGCHTGYFTIEIAEKYKKVIGLDILPHNILIAKEFFAKENIEYLQMDALQMDIKFQENLFDCIVVTEVIEHVQEPDLLIKKCRKLLKKGGILIISTPNAFSLKYMLDYFTTFNLKKALKKLYATPKNIGTEVDHIFNWDIFTLCNLFFINGFKIKEFCFAGAYLPNFASWIFRRIFHREPGEPKWMLPFLGRFASQLVIKFEK